MFLENQFHDPFDSFLNELRDKATLCNFKDTDRMIRDKLVFSVCDKLQQILLREENLTLKKAVQIYQAFEMANRNVTELQSPNTLVNKISRSKKKLFKQSRSSNNNCILMILMIANFVAKVISAD